MNNNEPSATLEFKNTDKLLKELEKLSHASSTLRAGIIVTGRVNNIKNFGAFVELPNGQTGLIHISEISYQYVKDINEILSIGQKIRVKILRVEDNKIELSLKQAQPIKLRIGTIVEGRVKNIVNFGAFVELPNGQTGFVHISKISSSYVKDIHSFLSVGQKVQVEILSVEDSKIELSLKQAPQPKPLPEPAPAPDKHEQKKIYSIERDKLGRAQNAQNRPFRFVPHSVIRPIIKEEQQKKTSLKEIVDLMSKGIIGAFEIGLVYWVGRLRFSNKAMLTDLVHGGFIDKIRMATSENPAKKMEQKLNSLVDHDLIRRVQIQSFEIAEKVEKNTGTIIYILNQNGKSTLKEIGLTDVKFSDFDIVQDGNTAKKILAANQWLVFMLTHFKETISENFETSNTFQVRADERFGAKFFGTVIVNGETLVGEAVRRVEDFEQHTNKNTLREKLERWIKIFDNFKNLYIRRANSGVDKFIIERRPVLIYICEDDEHIDEIRKIFADILAEHPNQEIWFTTDLRIFNKDMVGQRFLKEDLNRQCVVFDLQKRLGVQETATSSKISLER